MISSGMANPVPHPALVKALAANCAAAHINEVRGGWGVCALRGGRWRVDRARALPPHGCMRVRACMLWGSVKLWGMELGSVVWDARLGGAGGRSAGPARRMAA